MAEFSFVINGEYFGLLYSVSLDQHNCANKKIFLCGLCGTEFHNFSCSSRGPKTVYSLVRLQRDGRQNVVLLVLPQDMASESVFTTDFKRIAITNFCKLSLLGTTGPEFPNNLDLSTCCAGR
jgi:hypothetical protein